uniref:Translin n=1 Tax=Phytophthora ramorum TaxID=164328 RepID=H3GED9_PHYRM
MELAATSTEALLERQDFVDMNRVYHPALTFRFCAEMHEYDEMREKIIKRSREILKASKQAIFALHRADRDEALKLLDNAEKVIPELVALTEENPSLRDGALSSSLEEYTEAKCFCYYLDTKSLLPRRDVPVVQKKEYLGGVIDFTGDTGDHVEAVLQLGLTVEAISGELIQFDFRNGPLRRKFDSVKYNLRKLENTLYELSLVTNSGLTLQAHSVQETPAAPARDDNDE